MLPSIYDIWHLMPAENWNYIFVGVALYALVSFKDGFADSLTDEFPVIVMWFFLWPLMLLMLVINTLRQIFK